MLILPYSPIFSPFQHDIPHFLLAFLWVFPWFSPFLLVFPWFSPFLLGFPMVFPVSPRCVTGETAPGAARAPRLRLCQPHRLSSAVGGGGRSAGAIQALAGAVHGETMVKPWLVYYGFKRT